MTEDNPQQYEVTQSEAAEADIESLMFSLLGKSPSLAKTWYDGLDKAIRSLGVSPNGVPWRRRMSG